MCLTIRIDKYFLSVMWKENFQFLIYLPGKDKFKNQNSKLIMYELTVLIYWQKFLELRHMSSHQSAIRVTAATCAVTQQADGTVTAVSPQKVTHVSF